MKCRKKFKENIKHIKMLNIIININIINKLTINIYKLAHFLHVFIHVLTFCSQITHNANIFKQTPKTDADLPKSKTFGIFLAGFLYTGCPFVIQLPLEVVVRYIYEKFFAVFFPFSIMQ